MQELTPLFPGARGQFRAEELPWKTIVLHAHYVAKPSELRLHDHGLNARQLCSSENVLVCHSVIPGYAQDFAETAEMELIQLFDVSAIACPGFAAIQQGCKDYSPVDCDPCCLSYASLAPHPVPQAAKCTASFGQTAGYFFVQGTSGGQATAEVGEIVYIFQDSAVYLDGWI